MTPLPAPGARDIAWLLDLSSLARGIFHARKPEMGPSGEPVAVTAAVTDRLVRFFRELDPAFFAVCADPPTTLGEEEDPAAARARRYWRAKLWPGYKAKREPPGPEYDTQIDRLIEILDAHRIPVFRREGFEADDFFGALVPKLRRLGLRVVIISKDHDLWHLVRRGIAAWDGDLGGQLTDVRDVEKKYGVPPGWLPVALALAGDGDEAPGLKGIGAEKAAALVQRHGPTEGAPLDARALLDRILSRWQWESTQRGAPSKVGLALRDGAEQARLSLRLVELREDAVPVILDLAAMRCGWDEDAAERVRALGAELSIASLRGCRAKPKRALDDALARRWIEAEAADEVIE